MLAKLLRRTLISIAVMALLLFVPAGTIDWPSAWIFLGSQLVLSLAGGAWLAESNPELLEERLKPLFQPGQNTSDKIVLVLLIILGVSLFVVMGLDIRFGWSHVPLFVQILGALLLVPMGVLSYLTFRENRFAAPVVRVQKERGHHVVATGPYAYVRHPMYLARHFLRARRAADARRSLGPRGLGSADRAARGAGGSGGADTHRRTARLRRLCGARPLSPGA
jgi:protein-S-isoprenylcysteine O-methyltransferase Ste14